MAVKTKVGLEKTHYPVPKRRARIRKQEMYHRQNRLSTKGKGPCGEKTRWGRAFPIEKTDPD